MNRLLVLKVRITLDVVRTFPCLIVIDLFFFQPQLFIKETVNIKKLCLIRNMVYNMIKRMFIFIVAAMCSLLVFSQSNYYMDKAKGYIRDAEYYTMKAERYDREAEYYNKKAMRHLREAEYYSKSKKYDKVKKYNKLASEASEKACLQMKWANEMREKASIRMRYAKENMNKAKK